MQQILIANSIGLTGTEILIAELARHPRIAMLPGQNFIGHDGWLYRDRDYARLTGEQVFEDLATEYTMTAGRIWCGLTKNMSPADRARYDKQRHRTLFIARAPSAAASLFDFVRPFAGTYFEAMGWSTEAARYAGFFGQNAVLSHGAELARRAEVRVLSWDNRIDLWLATISQRMTWDCRKAAGFWIIGMLLLEVFSRDTGRLLRVDLERFVAAREAELGRILAFLELEAAPPRSDGAAALGFIAFRPEMVSALQQDAALIARIYGDCAAVKAARSFSDWAPGFVADAAHRKLLERYRAFWNSTSHTNFDWPGPLEDEILERVFAATGARDAGNLSLHFYHEMHALDSLTHDAPRCLKPRPLGVLEADIVLPLLPYFLKVAIEHLSCQAQIAARQAHSYRTLRQNPLYLRLQQPDAVARLRVLGLDNRLAALEEQIARTEERMREARTPRND
jgi:hypothetical protein